MLLSAEILRELFFDQSGTYDGVEFVDRMFVGSSRWGRQYWLTVRVGGKLYSVVGEEPATEMQEGQDVFPQQDSEGMVDCFEVEPYEEIVKTTRYRKITLPPVDLPVA